MATPYILFVDDDEDERFIMSQVFTEVGCKDIIKFAQSGIQALELLEKESVNNNLPQLILLDINMPKLNGIETLKAIKQSKNLHEVDVIMYSTTNNNAEKSACIALGATDFISKISCYQMLKDVVSNWCHKFIN